VVSIPNPKECFLYSKADKSRLYFFGIISFIALLTGMILFLISHPLAFFYVIFVILTFFYLTVSYIIGVFGKEFDLKKHQDIVNEFDFFLTNSRPTIDIYYPTCGESLDVQINALNYIIDLAKDYGSECKIYCLDDSKSGIGYEAYTKVKHRVERGIINYISREDKPYLKKAGNLRNAFKQTSGEFIIIFDADFCPAPVFITNTLPYLLRDPSVAIVQTPQYFSVDKGKSWVENGAAYVQELFYRLIQVNRNHFGGAICVGTNAVYRRKALEPFGGTAAIDYSEDVRTGFRCLANGNKIIYIPMILAKGLCPDQLPQFFLQQYRWCMGSISLFFSKEFWKAKITFMQRICYLSGMLYYITTGASVVFMQIPSVFMLIFAPSKILWFNALFSLPSLLFGTAYQAYWSKHQWGIYAIKSRVVSYYSHFFALYDFFTKNLTPWQPTGVTVKTKVYSRFQIISFWLSIIPFVVTTLLIGYHAGEFGILNFIPTLLLSTFNFYINTSILRDQV
jgi:cellulose synthase/poly-beta-1,6-N-acetylglucosamine synthase-like glycosyltransferase